MLSCVGLTFILKYGSIFNIPRSYLTRFSLLKELFKCSLCLGFWSGFIVFAIGASHYHLLPLASAGVSWIADIFNNILQSIEYFMDKKNNYEPKNPK